eukprot:309231-Pleurochrysis_carterae.AAC.1
MEDPPTGTRKLSRSLRAHHLRRLAREVDWRDTPGRRMQWAAALVAHNLLLRGREVGHPAERGFDPTRGLTWASVRWMKPSEASDGHEWALIHVVPIKDTEVRQAATPMPMRRRRRGGAAGADPLCPYDALRAIWEDGVASVPVGERTFGRPSASTPLFTAMDGAHGPPPSRATWRA